MKQSQAQRQSPTGLLPVLQRKRVLITVGAGGVGKTSTAAAVGLLGARFGRRTLVMTIDPARRLAASLGLQGDLDSSEREVPAAKLRRAGVPEGLLHAMMLDQKQTFDEVIRRRAPDEASVRRVMANKLYRVLSTRLAGGQEYAAMEKLGELVERDAYELLVLDTPPTANALDFLEAPHKMVDLIDSPAVNLFLKSYRIAGRFSFKVLGAAPAMVFRRLARMVGGEFLDAVAEYFADMQSLLAGFRDRAAAVIALLARQDVGFLIVTIPDSRAIDEAIALYERLVAGGMSPEGFIINRVHPQASIDLSLDEVRGHLRSIGIDETRATGLASALLRSYEQMQVLAEADAAEIRRLVTHCGEDQTYVEVPLFGEDIYDVDGLTKLGQYLA